MMKGGKIQVQKSIIILSAVLVVALVAAGYFVFTSQKLNSQITDLNSQVTDLQAQVQTANLNIYTKANVFDTKLHDLLQEHTFLLINTVRRSLDLSSAYTASLAALQVNINEVGALLTPVYGSNASQLVNLWNNKTNIFISYSNDLKNGNANANSNFASAASSYEEAVATFWSTTKNPYPILDKATIKQLVTDHMNNVKAAIDYWNAKDYTNYFNKLHDSYVQMGVYADNIANEIVKQNPTLFQ